MMLSSAYLSDVLYFYLYKLDHTWCYLLLIFRMILYFYLYKLDQEKIEDTNGVTIIRKSKERKHNGQMGKDNTISAKKTQQKQKQKRCKLICLRKCALLALRLIKYQTVSHELGQEWIVITTNGTYPGNLRYIRVP